MSASDDDLQAGGDAKPKVRYWLSQIKKAERDMQRWNKRCDKIRRRYLFESAQENKRRQFQMLWANQEILRPAVYAKCPEPMVQSRFRDGDAIIRITGELLERTMDVQVDLGDFNSSFELMRNDFLLYGRGVVRLRYDPEFEPAEIDDGVGDEPNEQENDADKYKGDEGQAETQPRDELTDPDEDNPSEKIAAEHVKLDFVHRKDLIHPHARNWQELPWVAFRAYLTRDELRKKWPKCADRIVLDCKPGDAEDEAGRRETEDSQEPQATIYEIWDKRNRDVVWIAKSYADVLEEGPPYLKLNGFYPLPKPAYGTLHGQPSSGPRVHHVAGPSR